MLRQRFLTITAFLFSISLNAAAGFWQTLFGDGDHSFVCYSRVHRNYYLVIFAAVLVITLITWTRYRLKKKVARQLKRQNDLIEAQNRDLLASIRYASRLQEAQKPQAGLLKKLIPESFFWLQPRDIVSGDF
ncbi:MAG TPA: hypothetical protein VI731_08930, partial [Bacteroidia bacterium]|nr:hypothetical protein [Bacteroidia bacterium]